VISRIRKREVAFPPADVIFGRSLMPPMAATVGHARRLVSPRISSALPSVNEAMREASLVLFYAIRYLPPID